jgi:predicted dinucleotide-binding enzyme
VATKPSIGIIGAGRLGTAIARQALTAGYEVRITNSRGPETLSLMLRVLLPGAQASTLETVIKDSDIIVLAIPLNQYKALSPQLFAGKIVIDAMNYWPPTEGNISEFMDENVTSSEYIQQYLKDAYVVKTLNHVAYNELEEHSLPTDHPKRRAVAIAGNDTVAKEQVEQFIDSLGFDAIDLGNLKQGNNFQPDTKLFNARLTKDEMVQIVTKIG